MMEDKEETQVIDPTVTEAPVYPTPPAQKPKRGPNKKIAIILAVVIVVLVGAGASAYFLLKPAPNKEETKTPATSAVTSTTPVFTKLTAQELVKQAKLGLSGEIKETATAKGSSESYKTYSLLPYKVAGYDFSVSPSVEYGFASFSDSATVAKDIAAIKGTLKNKGLSETILEPGDDGSIFAGKYESDDILCLVTDQKAIPDSVEASTAIGCADKTAYSENAVTLKPFFTAYAAESSNDTADMAIGSLKIKDSKTSGYKTATTSMGGALYESVGGFAALFYQGPDKVWHFFKGTQSQIPCTDFKTDDVKKAYVGESCYDEADEKAVVKL